MATKKTPQAKGRKADSDTPKTLQAAIRYFADPDTCLKYAQKLRWPGGVACPTCGRQDVRFLATRRLWECKAKHPKRQFSAKIGTLMEDSAIGLDKWFPAMWMLANCKNGISSYELGRGLGVTQKTAWFMLQRIRLAMQAPEGGKIGGGGKVVEADETFIGGKARSMNAKQRRKAKADGIELGPYAYTNRALVYAMLERGGRVRAMQVRDRERKTLLGAMTKHVERGSEVHTDELASYSGIGSRYYEHKVINHGVQYVDGTVHTNNVENFWNLLKRTLRGTYVSVEPFHLFRYLDEQAFRFNERKHEEGDAGRFVETAKGVVGKRLTYKKLIGADQVLHPAILH